MSAAREPMPAGPTSIRAAVLAWLILVAATVLSWWLGNAHVGGPLVLAVAFGKIFLVGSHFMEIRAATSVLRLIFGGWCATTWAVLTAQYLTV